MATRHGLPGQYGKSEATRRAQNMILIFLACLTYVVAALAFVSGMVWSKYGPTLFFITFAAALALFAFMWWGAIRYVDKVAKERLKYLRGAQSEAIISYVLEKELDDDWHIFNSVKLERDSDIDHVVVGPGGVFCISTKSHRGHFVGTPDGLIHNGKPCDFAQRARAQAAELASRLRVSMGRDVPWVQSVLAVAMGFTEGDVYGDNVWLVHADSISERIAPDKGRKKLDKQGLARTLLAIESIQSTAAAIYERPDREVATTAGRPQATQKS